MPWVVTYTSEWFLASISSAKQWKKRLQIARDDDRAAVFVNAGERGEEEELR